MALAGIFEHRRPGEQVLSSKVEAQTLDTGLLEKLLRETVVDSESLQTHIGGVHQEAVCRESHHTLLILGCAVSGTRPERILVGIGDHPLGSALVEFDHIRLLGLERIGVGTAVGAPEEVGAAGRIPVASAKMIATSTFSFEKSTPINKFFISLYEFNYVELVNSCMD